MTPKQRRSCARKRRHPTALAAGKEADRLFQETGANTRIYGPCRYCGGGWHVTGSH